MALGLIGFLAEALAPRASDGILVHFAVFTFVTEILVLLSVQCGGRMKREYQ